MAPLGGPGDEWWGKVQHISALRLRDVSAVQKRRVGKALERLPFLSEGVPGVIKAQLTEPPRRRTLQL